MNRLFLGIDLGTSAMKLVAIDERKQIVASRTEEYQAASLEKGWSEIDPLIWYECMKDGIRNLLKDIDGKLISGIGVTGQMHTLVTIDQEGKPLRPAIMWNDIRTKELLPELKEKIAGFEEGAYLSKTISTGSPAANLYWMSRYEKENFVKIHKFLIGPDYLVYCLTGHFGTDYCEASTSCLYLLNKKKWSAEMKSLIGLRDEAYPEIRGSAVSAGKLKKELSEELQLPSDVEVITGTGDNPATAVSTGCLGNGYPLISLGTSGVLLMPMAQWKKEATGKVILFSFDGKDFLYLIQGVVQSNGSTLEWWFKKLLGKADFSDLDKMLKSKAHQKNRLIFYPHLVGDKTIYADPDIRGAFVGLSSEMDRCDITYAVIEGLCFAFRELTEKMQLSFDVSDSVKVIGGGSRSDIWMQILANVLGVCVEQMDGVTGPGYGMALLAAYHEGAIDSFEHIASGVVQVKHRFRPEKEYSEYYKEKYRQYLRVYKGMKYIYGEPIE